MDLSSVGTRLLLFLSTQILQVVGAYFEKIGSTCFAVYSIAVTDAQNKTWFVKRRFTSFIHFYNSSSKQFTFKI